MTISRRGLGTKARSLISRDRDAMSPAYTREYPLVIKTASGSEVWDVDGNRFIDFMAGIGVLNVGHRHPRVVARVQEQLERFWHICLSDFYYEEAIELAELLQSVAPMDDTLVYFGNSGTEAVEAAVKLAMYATKRSKFIAFIGGFHGRTLGALSFTGSKSVQQEGFLPGVRVYHVPYPNPYRPILHHDNGQYGRTVIQYIERELFGKILPPGDVAGIVIEPIQGEGGYIVPSAEFFGPLRELCDKYGIALIVDEIQSGMGRTGRWWAIEHESVEPDIVCFAKGIASGMPIGGMIARRDLMNWDRGAHGSTFGGNPLAAVAGIETLRVIKEEGLLGQATDSGSYIMDALEEMKVRHPSIGDVRGRGLMVGVEFVRDKVKKTRASEISKATVKKGFENGLLLLPCGESAIRFIPALNIPRHLIDEGLEIFEHALSEAESEML